MPIFGRLVCKVELLSVFQYLESTVIPRFWRPLQIGDIIYLVSSWAHLLQTYNLDFGDFKFGDVNFARSQKSPKSRDDCNQFF